MRHRQQLLVVALGLATALQCTSPGPRHFPAVTTVTGIDLSRYSQRGFHFSQDSYSAAHDPVGMIAVTTYAEATLRRDSVQGEAWWEFSEVRAQDVLDSVYAIATRLGADALVKMEMTSVTRARAGQRPETPGLSVTGLAIKRRTILR